MSTDRRTAPRLSDPTAVDLADPFDSTDHGLRSGLPSRETQLSADPPTVLVRRDSFRELLPGSVVGEIYEIDTKLGAGAMGEVYAARHLKLGKRVAIKVISQRLSENNVAIERFAMEAKTLAQIQHPAIVAVDHVGELTDGRAYFVMELLKGETLYARLRRGGVYLPEALRILDQMARGVDAAHAQGVIHRDLKPENTFLVHLSGEAPVVKLLDYGLAKLAAGNAENDQRSERTQSGVAIGTPMYMSPEQARGPHVDYRTDIYALGCVAYELVLGVPPFPHAKTAPELYAAHLHESPSLPRSIWPEIPPQLDLVLFAMLAKDPSHRPTLAQVRSVFAAVQISSSQRAATEPVAPRSARLMKATIVAIVAGALIGGILIGVGLSNGSGSAAPPIETTTAAPISMPEDEPPAPELSPVVPPVAVDPRPESRALRPARQNLSRQPLKTPVDAGVDAVEEPPVLSKAKAPVPIDKNQIVNPFAKHKGIP